MKVGIVVPFSWSFWGAVVEHAELQAEALQRVGIETRTIIGNDPPGSFTRVLHPRLGRHDEPPSDVIPVGRSVIVPANGSLPNIVLSPRSVGKIRRALERERFDVLHLGFYWNNLLREYHRYGAWYGGFPRGLFLPRIFLARPYYFYDYYDLGIGPPPPGYIWVRYGPDLLLVNRHTGRIVDVIHGAFY